MKKTSWPFYLFCLCGLLLLACQDDNDSGVTPPGNGDTFEGSQYVITLQDETENFHYPEFICTMRTEDGTVITRRGGHIRLDGQSILTLDTGLKEGIYRLLYLTTPVVTEAEADTTWNEYGLGCRIEISKGTVRVLDPYNKTANLSGSGTAEDPFIISSYDHLKRLRSMTNDQTQNEFLTASTYFLQIADINMDKASYDSDHQFGWLSIGNVPNNPFRGIYDGNGYKIKNLWATRQNSTGIALFGYTEKAILKHVQMENPKMEGNFAVGALVGGAVSAGDMRDKTSLIGCTTSGGYIKASKGSVGAGGLVGVVDLYGMIAMDSCVNTSTPVSGSYGVGGLLGVGSLYSQSYLQQCENHASVSSDYTGAGGLVGSVDSLSILGGVNTGDITGSKAYNPSDASNGGYATGGIAGGTGVSYIYASTNEGNIDGYIGVGGIIGSTRLGSDELLFNNTLVKSCGNTGAVSGKSSVGGICGEAQLGCYAVYNTGAVSASASGSFVGGIAGNTSIAVVHNALNTGKVSGNNSESAGGVVGKVTWGAFFASQNFGDLDVNANYAGGIIGLAGNYTMINYCGNMGYILNSGTGPTGGLVGEIGDPREWSSEAIASCVIGSVECMLGILGPVIAVTGSALETAATTGEKIFKGIVHVLHVGETVADWLLLVADKTMFRIGVSEMLSEEEAELMEASLKAKVSEIDGAINDKMANIRNGYALSAGILPSSLNQGTATDFINNTNTLLTFYETSDDNNNTINYNINHKREERYEHIEQSKHIKEIVQKVIAGVCICAAATAGVVSGIATGGTTTAAVFATIGTVATLVGGVNAIVEGATDYQNNAVIISQCVNMGRVKADNASRIGGIVGHMQQYGIVKDCLNGGRYEGNSTKAGGIVGRGDSRFEAHNCLNVGDKWKDPLINSYGDFTSLSNLYYYGQPVIYENNSYLTNLSIDELCDPKKYKNWNINKTNSIWHVTESKGNFPVPFHSEMEEEIKE